MPPVPKVKVPLSVIAPAPVVAKETFVPVIVCVRVRVPAVLLMVVFWPKEIAPPYVLSPLTLDSEIPFKFRVRSSAPTLMLL